VIPEATEEVEQDVVITDPELDDAADAIDRGDLAAAVTAYEALLQREPFHVDGKAGLATVKLMQRTQGIELVAALNAAVHSPQDIDAHLVAADVLVLHARANEAFALMLLSAQRFARTLSSSLICWVTITPRFPPGAWHCPTPCSSP
jgi:thioredoxin-like negative regulator of GroEL